MNNYCVFEDKNAVNPIKSNNCNCDDYCPSKECLEFISNHKSDGKKINMKEIDDVISKNNIIKLEKMIADKKVIMKGKSEILKKDPKKAKIYAKNLLDNSNKESKFNESKEKKLETIKDYDKFMSILDDKKNRYAELNDEVFEEDIEIIKKIFLKKVDAIREKSELIEVDDSDFQKNKKNLEDKIDDFKADRKELNEIILKMDGEINTNKEILDKRKKDISKLNDMLDEDKKELKENTEKVDKNCTKEEKKCPDNLKKVLIILFIFVLIIYYSLYKINH